MRNKAEIYLVYIDLLMSNRNQEEKKSSRKPYVLQGLPTAIVICSYANNLVRHHLLSEDMP